MMISCNVVLELIRKVSLPDYVHKLPDQINWTDVIDISTEQGVLGVCFSAIEQLSADQRPDMDKYLESIKAGCWQYEIDCMRPIEEIKNEIIEKLNENI